MKRERLRDALLGAPWDGMPRDATGVMQNRNMSLRDRIVDLIAGGARATGASATMANRMRNEAGTAVDFIPGVGDAVGLDDAVRDYQTRNYGKAATGAALSALGLIPGAGDVAAAGVKKAMAKFGNLDEIRKAMATADGEYFLRWSAGPKYDMKPGAVSKDYASGQMHEGLSAVPIAPDMDDQELLEMINDYSYLRGGGYENNAPHIYRGKQVGRDSDGAMSIKPDEYLGQVGENIIEFLDNNDDVVKRMGLERSLKASRAALDDYYAAKARGEAKWHPAWDEEQIRKHEERLREMGGPVKLPW